MTFIQASIFSALRLLSAIMPRRSSHPTEYVFDVFDQHFEDLAGLGRRFVFFPLVAEDDAFALVADIDEDEVAVDADGLCLRRSG